VPNTIRSTYASAAAGALLVLMSAVPALPQEILGKTIQAKFLFNSCYRANNICIPPQTFHENIYVSPQGHVYEYTGPEKGKVYTLGVTTSGVTFTAEGNTLVNKSETFGPSLSFIYHIKGNTCFISAQQISGNFRNRVSTLECSVVEGNPN
jgi:hypothetical protein